MQALQAAGIKYVIFVAKHHDGFCLWPTSQTDYSVKSSPFENGQGDVVRRVDRAASKYGLKFGVYLSPWDRHEPRYNNSTEYDEYYACRTRRVSAALWRSVKSSGSTALAVAATCITLNESSRNFDISQPNTHGIRRHGTF